MGNKTRLTIFILQFLLACSVMAAENFRDYYAEPGIQPFKESINQNISEHIDPFSGSLQLKYTDLVVPGNGGMDIRVNRIYNSLQDKLEYRGVNGVGWTMHFGRIVVNQKNAQKMCNQNLWSVTVDDNPSLELPDGAREILALDPSGRYLITKSRWKAQCESGRYGMIVTSPSGTRYYMDHYGFEGSSNGGGMVSWYATKIEDVHGNAINIEYTQTGGFTYIKSVSSVDGRQVNFYYQSYGYRQLLSSIQSNGQIWRYNYKKISGQLIDYYQLTNVTRPDGTKWEYTYYPRFSGVTDAGSYSLKSMKYPSGGLVEYTYKQMYFDPANVHFPTTVIATKKTSGSDVVTGEWSFDYSIGGGSDVTTIHAPTAIYKYYHYGYSEVGQGRMWSVGLLVLKTTADLNGTLHRVERNTWDAQSISNENYWHGRSIQKLDTFYAVPLLKKSEVWREGHIYTAKYSDYDQYGNAGHVVETGNVSGEDKISTDYTYFTNPDKWILSKVQNEKFLGIHNQTGTITRQYNIIGDLLSETKYGVTTNYTYTYQGDVASSQDANGNITRFSNYYRGIAKHENRPENVSISRTVNSTGTLSGETNGRGNTTRYSYDDLNRLTKINFPIHASVDVSRGVNYKTLTRGRYHETVNFDSFGRPIKIERSDSSRGDKITVNQKYDALGQLTFISNPNSPTIGITTKYDALGRKVVVKNQDNTEKKLFYQDNTVYLQDERGNYTMSLYRAFGTPEGRRSLIGIQRPTGIATLINKNTLGLTTSVHQGSGNITSSVAGYTTNYGYDARNYLTSESYVEIGQIKYGRDNNGNMTSRRVNSMPATQYRYDGLDRLTRINYPNSTPDVAYTYDGNSNIDTESNSVSRRRLIRDSNDNPTEEMIDIEGNQYIIKRTYSDLDFLDTLTYPTGRSVTYNPDAFGRQHSASPYVTNITYHPSGQIDSFTYANGVTSITDVNERLWSSAMIVKSGTNTLLSYNNTFDGVGNITAIEDKVDSSYTRSMSYDGMNRLVTAKGTWGNGYIQYDGGGNITVKAIGATNTTYQYSRNRLSSISRNGATLRYQYDDFGNIKATNTHLFDFDDANNLRVVTITGAKPEISHLFGYDADNYRVTRINGGVKTNFVYGMNKNLMGEYNQSLQKDNIYVGSQLIATVENITNTPPIANAGPDQSVSEGALVILNGAATTDNEGGVLRYTWKQVSGTAVTLNASNSVTPTFSAPTKLIADTLVFSLTVTDPQGESSNDEVVVNISMLDTDMDGMSDFWEISNFGDLLSSGADDFDGDTISNLEEFKAGSDPTVAMTPEPVTVLNVFAVDGTNIVTWKKSRFATAYDLYWSTSPNITKTSGTLIQNVTSTFSHNGLATGATYYYKLVAKNAGAESTLSREISAKQGVGFLDYLGVLQGAHINTPGVNPYSSFIVPPKIASDGNGNAVAVWISDAKATKYYDQENWKLYFSRYIAGESKWSNPYAIADVSGMVSGSYDVAYSANGDILIIWGDAVTTIDPITNVTLTNRTMYSKRYSGNTGWKLTLPVLSTTSDIVFPHLKIDSSGNAILAWAERTWTGAKWQCQVYTQEFGNTTSWTVPRAAVGAITEGCDMQLEMNQHGDGILVWKSIADIQSNPSSEYEALPFSMSTGLGTPFTVTQQANIGMGNLDVAINSTGTIVASWSLKNPIVNFPENTDLWFREYNIVDGWMSPQIIQTRNNGLSSDQALINDNGEIVVSWNEPSSVDSSFFISQYQSPLGWSMPVSNPELDSAFRTPLLKLAHDGTVVAVYATSGFKIESRILRYATNTGWEMPLPLNSVFWDGAFIGDIRSSMEFDRYDNLLVMLLPSVYSDLISSAIESYYYKNKILSQPVAKVVTPINAETGDSIVLDGKDSYARDGSTLTYLWEQTSGFTVNIADMNARNTTITAPIVNAPTKLTFKLTVTSQNGETGSMVSEVMVWPKNTMPRAIATASSTVITGGGQVTLDGSTSTAPNNTIVSYAWHQISGPDVMIINGGTVSPNFDTGIISANGSIVIELTITDSNGYTFTDLVSVTLKPNTPPVANAGNNQTVNGGAYVVLDGSASTDIDGNALSYSWAYLGAGTLVLDTPKEAVSTFLAPVVTVDTVLNFSLTVTDSFGANSTSTTSVTVLGAP